MITLQNSFIRLVLSHITVKVDQILNYVHCKDEREMFIRFIEYLENDYPDILSGWNSEFFDIPYIINRIEHILRSRLCR
jgi:DNA polymerase elongation subunit (family B)